MKVTSLLSPFASEISPNVTLERAMTMMEDEGLRHLPVVEDGRVVGVLSDRDLMQATGWLFRADEPPGERKERVRDVMHTPPITATPVDSVAVAARRMLDHKIGCLPVVSDGALVGTMSDLDVLDAFRQLARGGGVEHEQDGPTSKLAHRAPLSVGASNSAEEALEVMREHRFHHLPVVDAGKVVGIVSDRDLRRAMGRDEIDLLAVSECMTPDPLFARPDMPLSTAASLMVDARVSALPVVDGKELTGILTVTDLLAACAQALEEA